MNTKRDYYDILGVAKTAGKDEIKKAYRKLAMQFHPDRNPGADAEAKFKEASEAAEVLLDDEKRKRYDQFGHAGVNGMGGGAGGFGGGFNQGDFGDLGDIFGDLFGDIFGAQGGRGGRRAGGRTRARAGEDLQTVIDVSFEEAAFGCEKTISLTKQSIKAGTTPQKCDTCHGSGEIRRQQGFFTIAQPCHKCGGTGEIGQYEKKKVDLSVKIPSGIDDGQRLKLSGEGGSGFNGGPSGDLYVLIKIKEHEFFKREGFDVYCDVPISFSQAALGAEIEVPTLSGKVSVKIPAGTQSDKKMRLKNKGIARLGGYGFGDQIMNIIVETPTSLSKEQRELFERLSQLEQSSVSNPMSKGFFDRVKELFQ
jgi:molecular chaperone DnaJ